MKSTLIAKREREREGRIDMLVASKCRKWL